jgi:nucleoid-associated protein YgaU
VKNDSAIIETDMEKLKEENQKLKADKAAVTSSKQTEKTGISSTKSKTRTDVPGIKEISGNTILYVVQQGDTLSRIAEKFYGDKRKWNYIFNTNRDLLKSQNDIKVGDTVKVPILK